MAQKRQEDIRKRTESPEMNPHKSHQVTFEKGTSQFNGTKSFFNKWCRNYWTSTCNRMDLDTDLMPFAKIKSKGVIDQTTKLKIVRPLEDNVRKNPGDLRHSDDFLD